MKPFADGLVRFSIVKAQRFAHLFARFSDVVKVAHVKGFERFKMEVIDDFCDLFAVGGDVGVGHADEIAEDHSVRANGDARARWMDFANVLTETVEEPETNL